MESTTNAEMAFIGSLILEPKFLTHSLEIVPSKKYLTNPKTREVYTALSGLINDDIAIDPITLFERIKKNDLNSEIDLGIINSYIDSTPTAHHWKHYADIVSETWKKNQVLGRCYKAIEDITNSEPLEVWKNLTSNASGIFSSENEKFDVEELINEISEIKDGHKEFGMSWGYDPLDVMPGRFHQGTIHVIAGRPGHGKTTLALHLAELWTDNKIPLLYESLEMGEKELAYRRMSKIAKIPLSKIRCQKESIDWPLVINAVDKIKQKKYFFVINDKKYKTPDDIAMDIKIAHDLYGIKVFILDHWHRIIIPQNGDGHLQRSEDAFEKIVGTCSNLGITSIILSQLNREGERREVKDKIPIISDIRGLNRIAEAADSVIFTYWPYKHDNSLSKYRMYLRIAKARENDTGDMLVEFYPDTYSMGGITR